MTVIKQKKRKSFVNANRVAPWANVMLNVFFTLCVIACLYPMLLVVGISFTENETLKDGYRIIPRVFSLEGYRFASHSGASITRAYAVTIFNTVVGTFLHVFICSLFAYPMSRPEFKHKKSQRIS